MSDIIFKVRFGNAGDVEEFVKAARKCDFDININYNSVMVDAKSFLGILGMDLSKDLQIHCYGEDPEFSKSISKFIIK